MLINFKMDQTLKLISELNHLRDLYNSYKFSNDNNFDSTNYSFHLLHHSVYILTRLRLLPHRIEADTYCNQPCVKFIYEIDDDTKLYIVVQPDYFFSYKRKRGGAEPYEVSKGENIDVVEWINRLVNDLLIKTLQEYDFPVC